MENAIKGIKEALRANPKSVETNRGAVRLPIVFVNKAKTKTTVKAVFPCVAYTKQQAEMAMCEAVTAALTLCTNMASADTTQEYYGGLHCQAHVVRVVLSNA